MKNLLEYLNKNFIVEGTVPGLDELAKKKCDSFISSLFKSAGINADVKIDGSWGQMNMLSDKNAPKLWSSILTGPSYAFNYVEINISAKYIDKLYDLMRDKFNVDIADHTKNFDDYRTYRFNNGLDHIFNYPTWRNAYGGPKKVCMYNNNGVYIFISNFIYMNSKNDTVDSEKCKELGNGDILKGSYDLVDHILIHGRIFVDISDLDNFSYNVQNNGGLNDCLGKPIQIGDLVVYQTSAGLEVGKVQEIKGKNISVLINNGFGKTITFNNGIKMCVINLLVK